jgi:uncharacterized membrane protein YsdA (DUF1294 family)
MLAGALLLWLVIINAVTLVAYARDKAAARRGGRRTPERTLWALDLAGGFIGGWIGMLWLRHKTRHLSFRIVQSVATLLWVGGLIGLVAIGLLP